MPYSGSCEHTRKMKSATTVYSTFSRNGTLRSADCTSGSTDRNGRTKCSTRNPDDMLERPVGVCVRGWVR